MVGGAAVNGFALGARLGSTREVLAHALKRHRSVFTRLAASYGLEPAEAEAEAARKARRLKSSAPWLRELGKRWQPIAAMLTDIAAPGDPFEIRPQLKVVARALHTVRPGALVALTSLLERIDSQITAQQLAVGDIADIVQTVRWQADLVARSAYERRNQAGERIETLCTTFLSDWETRAVGPAEYPRLVEQLLPALKQLCEPIADETTHKLLAGFRSHGNDAAALQGAHRQLLLNLEHHFADREGHETRSDDDE
jgi:hypothetical protein